MAAGRLMRFGSEPGAFFGCPVHVPEATRARRTRKLRWRGSGSAAIERSGGYGLGHGLGHGLSKYSGGDGTGAWLRIVPFPVPSGSSAESMGEGSMEGGEHRQPAGLHQSVHYEASRGEGKEERTEGEGSGEQRLTSPNDFALLCRTVQNLLGLTQWQQLIGDSDVEDVSAGKFILPLLPRADSRGASMSVSFGGSSSQLAVSEKEGTGAVMKAAAAAAHLQDSVSITFIERAKATLQEMEGSEALSKLASALHMAEALPTAVAATTPGMAVAVQALIDMSRHCWKGLQWSLDQGASLSEAVDEASAREAELLRQLSRAKVWHSAVPLCSLPFPLSIAAICFSSLQEILKASVPRQDYSRLEAEVKALELQLRQASSSVRNVILLA